MSDSNDHCQQLGYIVQKIEHCRNQIEQMQFYVNDLQLAASVHDQLNDLAQDMQTLIDSAEMQLINQATKQ